MSDHCLVKELTDEQRAKLPEYRDWGLRAGLSTEPADRARAEAAVKSLYRLKGLSPPHRTIWVDSPQALHRTAVSPGETASTAGRAKPDRQWDQHITSDAYIDVGRGIYDPVMEATWSAVGSHLNDHLGSRITINHSALYYTGLFLTQWDMEQIAPNLYTSEVLGQGDRPTVRAVADLASSCGMAWFGRDRVVLSERYSRLHLDPEGRLHSESGMAVTYPDGWGLWCVHGVKMEAREVLKPGRVPLAAIQGEGNLERKRVLIERWAGRGKTAAEGWSRYLKAVNAEVIDQRRNDAEATTETLVTTPGHTVLICGCPSTGRVYCLEVDPRAGVATCEEAQNWLSGGLAGRVISAA